MVQGGIRKLRWSAGTYSSGPRLVTGSDGNFVAECSVDCWKGTIAELSHALSVLERVDEDACLQVRLTFADGQEDTFYNLQDLEARLVEENADLLVLVRAEISSADGQEWGRVVVGPRIPGVQFQLGGRNELILSGLVSAAYRTLMIGYVDRLGGFRAPALMLTTLTPMYVLYFFANGILDAQPMVRLGLLALVIIGSVAVFHYGMQIALVGRGFEIVDRISERPLKNIVSDLKGFYARPVVKAVIAATLSVLLGAIGSELSSAVVFPWEG